METLPEFSSYDGQFITPRIAVGARLQPDHVPDVVSAGIRGIINVMGCCDRQSMAYLQNLPEDVYWTQIGFWDGWLMPNVHGYRETLSAGFARMLVQRSAMILREHSPVLVHCAGGFGRSANLTAILIAASEGMTPDEAIELIQKRRTVAPFAHEGFWKAAGSDNLVALARQVLAEKETPTELFRERVLNGYP